MCVSSLPKTVTRQRRDCDLNPGSSAPEFSTLTTRLPSHPWHKIGFDKFHQSAATVDCGRDRLAALTRVLLSRVPQYRCKDTE